METSKLSLPPKPTKSLNAFLTGQPEEKGKSFQLNIKVTAEEIDLIRKGHEACLEKMPGYEYHKRAILEKSKQDIEKREKLNKVIADLN